MASRRSRSPSTPSEGEIIESGSETKATTSQLPLNGTSVDRPTRASTSSAPRSAASLSRSPRRRRSRTRTRSTSRTRSRSPYRDHRGYKRRRDDDYDRDYNGYDHDDRRYRPEPSRRAGGSRYDDNRYSGRGQPRRPYYDYDREEHYGDGLRYSDESDRRREKRARTRSRSPYHEVRKPKQYSGDEWDSQKDESAVSRIRRRKPSIEQSVSERGNTSVVASRVKQDAETQKPQVQQASGASNPRLDRYVAALKPLMCGADCAPV
ncbi:hypothetical protein BO71DRAFT_97878 [Aspergillus ellipticus CBS 707.79]|uniref:Uncharacterized protein n=1 Tax=Aspergillus ellipticus CBS 707.79 TaxID=1448320 RepID=A0A319EFL0_9EURO|nr:hypothetical protein BO71DRAFT_97878 [Aspergillus ellipticus CBS 707.79]